MAHARAYLGDFAYYVRARLLGGRRAANFIGCCGTYRAAWPIHRPGLTEATIILNVPIVFAAMPLSVPGGEALLCLSFTLDWRTRAGANVEEGLMVRC